MVQFNAVIESWVLRTYVNKELGKKVFASIMELFPPDEIIGFEIASNSSTCAFIKCIMKVNDRKYSSTYSIDLGDWVDVGEVENEISGFLPQERTVLRYNPMMLS
jgi:O-methyltransferase involved in polyketide biosynthesis